MISAVALAAVDRLRNGSAMRGRTLTSLLAYVTAERRVCPMPGPWEKLRRMLGPNSPPIAILTGWHVVPPLFKALILDAQLRYAAEHGKLAHADRFLRSLPPKAWKTW